MRNPDWITAKATLSLTDFQIKEKMQPLGLIPNSEQDLEEHIIFWKKKKPYRLATVAFETKVQKDTHKKAKIM